jgi:hypothetical protein
LKWVGKLNTTHKILKLLHRRKLRNLLHLKTQLCVQRYCVSVADIKEYMEVENQKAEHYIGELILNADGNVLWKLIQIKFH